MPTDELIIGVCCIVDTELADVKWYPKAKLYPGELVTLMVIFSVNGGYYRIFYRWILFNYCNFLNVLHPENFKYCRKGEWNGRYLISVSFFG
ncbi:hypothetical protein [Kallotenue papyrolyticum]|uniref:hypothetical protein n=1 Tax=Kallotenue papyrolyticum TaxID=1325125 RepID=UPI00126827E0|nr:hypothetical protein [Kallotenue papyrolyticum]